MKKLRLRAIMKLRELSNKVLGEEETNRIIKETTEKTVNDFLKELEPKPKKRAKKGEK